jgi:hypothetical protein
MFTKLYNQNKYQNFIQFLLTMSVIFYTFQQQICSMTEQDLFYFIARVEGVGDIIKKTTHCGSAEVLKKDRSTCCH